MGAKIAVTLVDPRILTLARCRHGRMTRQKHDHIGSNSPKRGTFAVFLSASALPVWPDPDFLIQRS